jgi:CheY-like chemotaxis protein
MMQSEASALRILIADDDTDDHYFITEAIRQEHKNALISSVYNGQELIDYLLKRGSHTSSADPMPHFVLLDINMPKINGLEALKELRKHSLTSDIKFFVLSTSQSSEDIRHSFALNVEGFYTKPNTMPRLKLIVQQIIWRFLSLPEK